MKKLFASFLSAAFLLAPSTSFALVLSINSLNATNQFLATTTGTSTMHMKVNSVTATHTFQWDGTPWRVDQGGTGASAFTGGSILFFSGGAFAQDNNNLYWDGTNSVLGIGTNALTASSAMLTVKGASGKPLLNLLSSAGASQVFVDQNGNTGFGNTSPQHKVDVSGAIYSRLVTASSPNIDWNAGNVQTLTLTNNQTITFANGQAGGEYTLILKQDAAGGHTVTWPANVKWPGGTAPTLTSSPNAIDVMSFVNDGSSYLGKASLNYSSTPVSPGIEFANATVYYEQGTLSMHSFSHTVPPGNNRVLFLAIEQFTSPPSDFITSVTYNGVPMTRVAYTAPGNQGEWLYVLFNPDVGAHDVVVTLSPSGGVQMDAVSYTGATNTGSAIAGLDDVKTNTNFGTTITATTTPTHAGDWVLSIQGNDQDNQVVPGAGINATRGYTLPFLPVFGDSDGPVTANVPYAMTWNNPNAAGYNGMIIVSLVPAN